MKSISVFDIFKVSVGPSSSHTLGPWNAALSFTKSLTLEETDKIQVHLYGSLSKTGIGHATDKAIVLGLLGYIPEEIDCSLIDSIFEKVCQEKILRIGSVSIPFDVKTAILFEKHEHKLHPNTLLFKAFSKNILQNEQVFASVGGGFIESEGNTKKERSKNFPYPIEKGADLLRYTQEHNCPISEIVFQNELTLRSESDIQKGIHQLLETMLTSVYNGCKTEGVLPGGLQVKRRAKKLCDTLINHKSHSSKDEWIELISNVPKSFATVNKWVSCFAIAVNEENAAMGKIVTSPTNGAAGVIPAVFMYYLFFCDHKTKGYTQRFLLTAGEIGCLFKKGATISAAVGGCQAEIGVSSAMAAGGLTEILGGTPAQCLMAAEIAMEHHLGLTCDPVNGLVQVPCIERNAMGAIKAITAAHLALERAENEPIVDIDVVIKTMWEVAKNMHAKYRETADGGLAVHLNGANPKC